MRETNKSSVVRTIKAKLKSVGIEIVPNTKASKSVNRVGKIGAQVINASGQIADEARRNVSAASERVRAVFHASTRPTNPKKK